MHEVIHLDVPALPRVAPARVFDAWSWCTSDRLEWRKPACKLSLDGAIGGDNPPGLAFVLRQPCPFLPCELARLHVFGQGLDEELALAPWAIDEATDLLHEHRRRPGDTFWLAASSLVALVWGLHDWVHFHNHGPFDEPALTELQCDLVALAWLKINASRIGLDDARIQELARDLAALSHRRFDAEKADRPDIDTLFAGDYPTAPF